MPTRFVFFALSSALVLAACHSGAHGRSPRATAAMYDASGRSLGVLELAQSSAGVRITGSLAGLPAGVHGIHFHQVGRCEGPAFATAGAHFNPFGKMHGLENPDGPHAGDLSNLVVPPETPARVDLLSPRVTLDDGAATLFDADGTALVIHAAPDDEHTDPSGNSGARIACGVIARR